MDALRTWFDELGRVPAGEYDHTLWVFPFVCVLCGAVACASCRRLCRQTSALSAATKFVFLLSFTLAAWAAAFSIARWFMFVFPPN